ncbi:MAG: hypothetical protein AB1749_07715 [Pseudomonadota bacterium]
MIARRPSACIVMAALAASLAPARAVPGSTSATAYPDWPCVQHKVAKLSSVQIWDGPPVEDIKEWWNDPGAVKLVPLLVSRRVPVAEAEKAIERYAKELPEAERDQRLTVLFAGALARTNETRASVLSGIERFQRRQRARAEELERQGIELARLHKEKDAGGGEAAEKRFAEALERYDWDARVFQERQQNIPLACEIPVLIESRIFEIGRAIRSHMKE